MQRVLFICGRNRLRSPTAEQLYAETPGLEVASAGLNNDSPVRVSPELLDWSDRIFVMEQRHRARLSRGFMKHLRAQPVTCLDIPDDYAFMDPALLSLLKSRLTPFIGPPLSATAHGDPDGGN